MRRLKNWIRTLARGPVVGCRDCGITRSRLHRCRDCGQLYTHADGTRRRLPAVRETYAGELPEVW